MTNALTSITSINSSAIAEPSKQTGLTPSQEMIFRGYMDGTKSALRTFDVDLYEQSIGGKSTSIALYKGMQAVNQYLRDLGSDVSRKGMANALDQVAKYFVENVLVSIDAESLEANFNRALSQDEDQHHYAYTTKYLKFGKRLSPAAYFPWAMLTFEDIDGYIRWCIDGREKPLSESSIRVHVSAIKRVMFFCQMFGVVPEHNAMRIQSGLKVPKATRKNNKKDGRVLEQHEIMAIVAAAAKGSSEAICKRDSAIVLVMKATGLRREEVVNLLTENYNREAQEIYLIGKGSKSRVVPLIDKKARKALNDWIDFRAAQLGEDTEILFLFNRVHRSGKINKSGLTKQTINDLMKKLGSLSDVHGFSPHDIRRTFATDLIDSGTDVHHVQHLMGHASAATTQIYNRKKDSQAKEAVRKFLEKRESEESEDLDSLLDSI